MDEDDSDTATEVQTYKFVPAQNLFGDRKILKFDPSQKFVMKIHGSIQSSTCCIPTSGCKQNYCLRPFCWVCEIFLLDFYTTTLVIADVTVCDSRVKTARITESGFFVPYPPAFVLLVRVPILRPPPPRRRRPP